MALVWGDQAPGAGAPGAISDGSSTALLQGREREVRTGEVGVHRTLDVLGPEGDVVVPRVGDRDGLLDDLLVDVGPGLAALVTGRSQRRLGHRVIDRLVVQQAPVHV